MAVGVSDLPVRDGFRTVFATREGSECGDRGLAGRPASPVGSEVVQVEPADVPAWDAVLTGVAHRLLSEDPTALPDRVELGLSDIAAGYDEPEVESPHEMFVYVLSGRLQARTGGKPKSVGAGDIIHVPRGESYRLQVASPFARYTIVCSTPFLEERIDNMSPEEAEQARLNMKAN